jgi:hypothetical protein
MSESRADFHIELTERQREIILGGLLGDMSLLKRHENSNIYLGIGQSLEHSEYVNWLYKELQNFVDTEPKTLTHYDKRTAKTYSFVRFATLAYEVFNELYSICYPEGVKYVTEDWLEQIKTPLALAIWYMDDGTNSNNNCRIATCSFSDEEHETLLEWLNNKWDLIPELGYQSKGKYPILYFPADERNRLFALIRPYILSSMLYKMQSKYVNSKLVLATEKEIANSGELVIASV